MLNRTSSATGSTIGEQLLGATIDLVASPSQWSRDTVIPAPLFADLPAPVLAKAQKESYDDNGRQESSEKLTGVTYEGKVYLVQGNTSGELEAEEVLLHGNGSNEKSKAHRRSPGWRY